LTDLDRTLRVFSLGCRYHPMQDWLEALPPHQGDPIGELIRSVTVEGDLWPIAMETWLTMVVEAVCGWHNATTQRQLHYCLVLQGAQGIGKTQFFARLGGPWILTEAEVQLGGSTNAEESQLRTLRWPMVELAELDGMTRKQDVADMKAFLSRPFDELRRKYGRDALRRPRMTGMCGTVNVGQFLVDQTGNRRWVPIKVLAFDWDKEIDMAGVWAQAYAIWQQDGFQVLTGEEEEIRAREAVQFTQTSPEVDALDDQFDNYGEQWDQYFALGKREICVALRLGTRMMNTSAVHEYMGSRFGEGTKIEGKKRCWAVPLTFMQQSLLEGLAPVTVKKAKEMALKASNG
jgi:putative DNA primase/helicase